MFRHTFVLSCFILFSPQFLHTAARPLLPSLNATGEPYRAPAELRHATFDLAGVPLNEALALSFRAISHNLGVAERIEGYLPFTNNCFCPIHGLLESPKEKDHVFTPGAKIKMSLKKVTAANAQAWITAGHSAEARKTRVIIITLLARFNYEKEVKELVEKVFSHTWSCLEEAE